MADRTLRNCRILVVEDEYLLAEELAQELGKAGAVVLGPVPTIECALALLQDQPSPDGTILDVNLGGVPVYSLADMLIEHRIPLVFTTGYDPSALLDRFARVHDARSRSTWLGSLPRSSASSPELTYGGSRVR